MLSVFLHSAQCGLYALLCWKMFLQSVVPWAAVVKGMLCFVNGFFFFPFLYLLIWSCDFSSLVCVELHLMICICWAYVNNLMSCVISFDCEVKPCNTFPADGQLPSIQCDQIAAKATIAFTPLFYILPICGHTRILDKQLNLWLS